MWFDPQDNGYRNESARYNPGTGPELFEIDGVKATCFICSDGDEPPCIEQAAKLKPQVVFYPNNRVALPDFEVFSERAKKINALMLVTNRTGRSWCYDCKGGNVIFSADGDMIALPSRSTLRPWTVLGHSGSFRSGFWPFSDRQIHLNSSLILVHLAGVMHGLFAESKLKQNKPIDNSDKHRKNSLETYYQILGEKNKTQRTLDTQPSLF